MWKTCFVPCEGRAVYVVDDEDAVRQSLSLLLRMEGFAVTAFHSGDAFLEVADGLPFGCVLLDLLMPGRNGWMVLDEMTERRLPHPIVMITAHGDVPVAVRALKSGVFDFLEKPLGSDAMLRAVLAALASGIEAQASSEDAREAVLRIASLSSREADILRGMIAGRQNKMMARDLGISPRTVETYRSNVMAKLGVQSLPEAVRMGLAAGMASEA